MISFRYHLITIAAVFLALGLGVLAGTTVINQGLVNNLTQQTERLQGSLTDLQGEVSDLKGQIDDGQGFVDALVPFVAPGQLAFQRVVIVTQEGVDDTVLSTARAMLDAADAEVVAELSVRPQMASTDPSDEQDLATALAVPLPSDGGSLAQEAAHALAARLATAPPIDTGPGQPDLLKSLLEGGFLVARGSGISNATPGEVGGTDEIVVVLAGGKGDPAIELDDFMIPLVQDLVNRGIDVAAGEPTTTAYRFVERLRSDALLEGPIVTVDDLDQTTGGLALILGLHALVVDGVGGDYGVKAGARLLPEA